jgi:hypothetical protein
MTRTASCIALFMILGALLASPAYANWPANGVLACEAANNHTESQNASDGAGGIVVTWTDIRNGAHYDIYVQRIDGWGRRVWDSAGIPVCTSTGDQQFSHVASDGSGGAIVTWEDFRGANRDIYVQRINGAGTALWAANGVAVCTAAGDQVKPQVTSDGAGGAIVTWADSRSGTSDIYAQKLNASGAAQWTANGLLICNAAGNQTEPRLVHDGYGGAFFTWTDGRGANLDLYAAFVDEFAVFYWTANGVAVCTATGTQQHPELVTDPNGGIVVTWEDYRSGASPLSYAQRIDINGAASWTANGVKLSSSVVGEYQQRIAGDGAGGAIVTWYDVRSGNGDIYVQRIGVTGALMWNAAGVALCTAPNYQLEPRIAGDGLGGAIVTWKDQRIDNPYGDIYARRVDPSGVPMGPANGVAICALQGGHDLPHIASDGAGGAIVTWEDSRGYSGQKVYAQRFDRFDQWGYPSPDIASALDVPGDQGGLVNVAWDASRLDPWPNQDIQRYTVWRAIDAAMASDLTSAGVPIVSLDNLEPSVSKAIRSETVGTQTLYWELMADVDAYYLNGYAHPVATLFDSTATSPDAHHFQVIAHSFNFEYWISAPATGRSRDNIAPASPLLLTATLVGVDVLLIWNPSGTSEADFNDYAVYRATSSGVQPVPGSFLSGTIDTTITDFSPPTGTLYYIVTARDVHENQSAPSNEASVAIPTGIGDHTPGITGLMIGANYPNPFNASTEVRIGLPRESNVRLEVYDVAGRRVAARDIPLMAAGWQSVTFDGRDARGKPLASGVYFGKVTAGGETRSMKMVIRR